MVPANSEVGILSATDTTPAATALYTLVSGDGDDNNDDFTIIGDRLLIIASPDFEAQAGYSVRIQVSDGLLVDADMFAISVNGSA